MGLLFTSQIYQTKVKCKNEGSYFFCVFTFQKFLIFHKCVFSENVQCFVEHSFKDLFSKPRVLIQHTANNELKLFNLGNVFKHFIIFRVHNICSQENFKKYILVSVILGKFVILAIFASPLKRKFAVRSRLCTH